MNFEKRKVLDKSSLSVAPDDLCISAYDSRDSKLTQNKNNILYLCMLYANFLVKVGETSLEGLKFHNLEFSSSEFGLSSEKVDV